MDLLLKPFEVNGNIYEVHYEGFIVSPRGVTLKPMDNGAGYQYVSLGKGAGGYRHFYIHILVCTLFHSNPENLPEVNHKDGNKSNNHGNNLEWTDRMGNVHDYIAKGRARYPPRRKVEQYNYNGTLLHIYEDVAEAVLAVGCTRENIQMAANPNHAAKTAKGYIWKYRNTN